VIGILDDLFRCVVKIMQNAVEESGRDFYARAGPHHDDACQPVCVGKSKVQCYRAAHRMSGQHKPGQFEPIDKIVDNLAVSIDRGADWLWRLAVTGQVQGIDGGLRQMANLRRPNQMIAPRAMHQHHRGAPRCEMTPVMAESQGAVADNDCFHEKGLSQFECEDRLRAHSSASVPDEKIRWRQGRARLVQHHKTR